MPMSGVRLNFWLEKLLPLRRFVPSSVGGPLESRFEARSSKAGVRLVTIDPGVCGTMALPKAV